MSGDSERQFLLACLVALLRRARGTVVIEEAHIVEAYDSLDEITWARNQPTGTMRLSVPTGEPR